MSGFNWTEATEKAWAENNPPAHREAQPETDGGGEAFKAVCDHAETSLDTVPVLLRQASERLDMNPPDVLGAKVCLQGARLAVSHTALQPTPEGQTEGAVMTKERIAAIVEERMMDVWNDIAADTGCHPDDIKQLGRKRLMFTGGHWSRITGEFVASDIFDALASKGV